VVQGGKIERILGQWDGFGQEFLKKTDAVYSLSPFAPLPRTLEEPMNFPLEQHGAVFSTRPKGRELRELALSEHARGEDLVVSFAGIESVSYSFADEFLGPLLQGEDRIVLEDVEPRVHRIIASVLRRRAITVDEAELFVVTA
jgi:hypothetical protein